MFQKTKILLLTNQFCNQIFCKASNFILLLILINSGLVFGQKTLGLTKIKAGHTENGYVLFAPLYCKTTYLIDKCGKQINSWKSDYNSGYTAYLLPDGGLLRSGHANDSFYDHGGKGGVLEKFDWNGKLVWSYNISNDSLAQHHDFLPMDNGNILLIAWHGITRKEAEAKGRLPGTIFGKRLCSERIIEIKPKGINEAEVVWQWSLWDHIAQELDPMKPNFTNIAAHPELFNLNYGQFNPSDWIHLNSIDYNKELDQIVLSNHHMSEIWIIDHSTTIAEAASHSGGKYGKGGDFLYRWGNPEAYNNGGVRDQKLFKQHSVHWIPKGYKDEGDIMIFNNGTGRDSSYSCIDIITPPVTSPGNYIQNIPFGPSKTKWTYKDSIPGNFFSPFQSSTQRLFNGNTIICGGPQGRFFEINDKNKIVWEYINPVSRGDTIIIDGNRADKNSVFRCIFYSDSYGAFKGRKISAGSPIEINSIPYICNISNITKKKKKSCRLFKK